MNLRDYLVYVDWGRVPDDKSLMLDLTDNERSHVDVVLNWEKENDRSGLAMKDLLFASNIDKFLVIPSHAHVRGRKHKVVVPQVKRRASQPGGKRQASQTDGSLPKRPRGSVVGGEFTGFAPGAEVEVARAVHCDSNIAIGEGAPNASPGEKTTEASSVRVSP